MRCISNCLQDSWRNQSATILRRQRDASFWKKPDSEADTGNPLCQFAPNPAMQTNYSHSFIARDIERIAEPEPEATEDLRLHLVPRQQLLTLLDSGQIAQALHAAPLLRYLTGEIGSR